MSKLVLFLFLGVCVMSVHMAPQKGTEEEREKNRAKVTSYGAKVEAKVQKKNRNFKWDEWWSEAQPILTIVGQIVPATEPNREELCSDDDEDKVMMSHGPEIQKKVRESGNRNFVWTSWYNKAKPVLKVIGDIALYDEIKKYCPEKLKD